jgi:hypothetical protein
MKHYSKHNVASYLVSFKTPWSYDLFLPKDLGEGNEAMCQTISSTYSNKHLLRRGLGKKSFKAQNKTNQKQSS